MGKEKHKSKHKNKYTIPGSKEINIVCMSERSERINKLY